MSESGEVSYLFENSVIFTPASQSLMLVEGQQQRKLKPTAAQCLLLLIQNQGQIVTQNELLAFAWGENHRQVSFNAFYQSILSLRKSFTHLQLEKPIITTVPRKGLVIQADVIITRISTPEIKEEHPLPVVEAPLEPVEILPPAGRSLLLSPTEWIIIAFTAIICGALLYPGLFKPGYFSSYVPAPTIKGECHYYVNTGTSDISRHSHFAETHPQLCSAGEYIYITAYPEIKNLSAIICDAPLHASAENTCRSVYYPRYNNQ